MKFSEQWLREWVNPNVTTQQLSHQLTMAGLEIDGINAVAGEFNHVVVGQITEAVQHPDANRLRVCQVDVGQQQALNIVCGAANARAGIKVCVAMIGAVLPGDFKITKAKLRGVESFGMLCSAKELGISGESDGIIELPLDAPVGKDLRQYLSLDDHMIEVGLTANRGDCLSVLGLAREVAAINRTSISMPVIQATSPSIKDSLKVALEAKEACPRYVGRVIKGIRLDAKTPEWMVAKLQRSGVRSIHPIVDIANFVMMALGQPMHAFDLAKLTGDITVRHAKVGESLKLLDGNSVNLKSEHLVIADGKGPLALAGVMGGEASAVSTETETIFLEAAHFAPLAIAGKARALGLHTDSSHRFERGVDPGLPKLAIDYATQLILDIAGGEAGPVVLAESVEHLPKPISIQFDLNQVKRVLGFPIPNEDINDILHRLGFSIEKLAEKLKVTAPSWRFDMSISEDLVEEVARLYGYDKLPSVMPAAKIEPIAQSEKKLNKDRIKALLVDRGFAEAITYSFIDPKLHEKMFPAVPAYTLVNPIASDMALMRTSLMPGLLQALLHNIARQQSRVRLFEVGRAFSYENKQLKEIDRIGLIIYGSQYPEHWDTRADVDFYDLKGEVEGLLALTGFKNFSFRAATDVSILHPGQAAYIERNGQIIGVLGALHPNLAQVLDIRGQVFMAEIDLSLLIEAKLPIATPVSKFPSIRRDIALVVSREVEAAALCNTVKQSAGEWLYGLTVFDQYEGEKIESGKKSVALGLTLQHQERTLTDEEVVNVMKLVMTALQETHQAQLRE